MKRRRNLEWVLVVVLMVRASMTYGESVEVIGDLYIKDPDQGVAGIIFGDLSRQEKACWGTVTSISTPTNSGLNASPSPITTTGSLSVDTNYVQRRVTGSCPSGQSIRTIDASGAVTCQPDSNSGGTVTSVSAPAGSGLIVAPNPITTAGTLSVSFAGTGSASTAAKSDHNHWGQDWSGNSGSYGLVVDNAGTGDGIRASSNGIYSNYAGLYGVCSSSCSGVYGSSSSGAGVYGITSSGSYAVEGYTAGTGRAGYFHIYNPSSGNDALKGETNGEHGKGVYGAATGTFGIGVYGDAPGIDGVGVYGHSLNWAGYFVGDVNVNGNLSKSGGSFKIDHPLDPENKYLYHSFVESPDMKNIYDGVAVLDNKGAAWIELPEWFEVLNKDFRYQLTCIGGFAQVYIAEEISGNRFKIAGGRSGLKVSWQVTGIRKDPYAEAHRIPVEELKTPEEQGHYIHPDLYSKPAEKSVEWARNPEMMKKMKEQREKLNRS